MGRERRRERRMFLHLYVWAPPPTHTTHKIGQKARPPPTEDIHPRCCACCLLLGWYGHTLKVTMDPSTSHASSSKEAEPNESASAAPAASHDTTKLSTSSEHQQHVTPKRKSAPPQPKIAADGSEDSTDDANEAKRSRLMAPPSPLQALVPAVSGSTEEMTYPQHQQFSQTGKDDTITAAAQEKVQEESSTIQMVKDAYDQYVIKLEASGGSIEKEMTKQSDLLYVVSSISRREGDPFGPCLHGIYTTCQKAQEAARKTFEKVSDSYRDGNFVSHEKRVAKCDMTNFLIPGVEGAFRTLFEVFRPDDDCPEDCTSVAINTVHIESDVEQSFPYIQDTSSAWIKSGLDSVTVNEKSSAGIIEKNLKVHALFSYKACGSGDEMDAALIGIYKDREVAINRAREYSKEFIDDDQIEVSYNFEVTNGEIIVADNTISVSIETVILDDEDSDKYGEEIEFSIL
eukprot:scaffold9563_cov150-Skeletonema_marinoi.AAC.3